MSNVMMEIEAWAEAYSEARDWLIEDIQAVAREYQR